MNTGIYIHIPFCRSKCDYCSFYSIPAAGDYSIVESYVGKLVDEINRLPYGWFNLNADTIYFGGGTPSILKPLHVEMIIEAVNKNFDLRQSSEITLEMNPDDLSIDKISGFLSAGVNRIVLGVQSLDDELRNFIGRKNRWCGREELELFFSHGNFTRCIDLITGIPGQSDEKVLSDLEIITGFKPHHISLYLLSVEEGTPLAARFSPDDSFENVQVSVWRESIDFLKQCGYNHYEISNYSLPGFESRHNSKYWHFIPYAGFGAGAHSFTGTERYSNNMSVSDYLKSDSVSYTFDRRGPSDIIVEFFMTALRDLRGFTESEFAEITGNAIPPVILEKINLLCRKELLERRDGRILLTGKGLFVANTVIYTLTEDYI